MPIVSRAGRSPSTGVLHRRRPRKLSWFLRSGPALRVPDGRYKPNSLFAAPTTAAAGRGGLKPRQQVRNRLPAGVLCAAMPPRLGPRSRRFRWLRGLAVRRYASGFGGQRGWRRLAARIYGLRWRGVAATAGFSGRLHRRLGCASPAHIFAGGPVLARGLSRRSRTPSAGLALRTPSAGPAQPNCCQVPPRESTARPPERAANPSAASARQAPARAAAVTAAVVAVAAAWRVGAPVPAAAK